MTILFLHKQVFSLKSCGKLQHHNPCRFDISILLFNNIVVFSELLVNHPLDYDGILINVATQCHMII